MDFSLNLIGYNVGTSFLDQYNVEQNQFSS